MIKQEKIEIDFVRQRLNQIVEKKGIRQRILAQRAGLTPTALSNILVGRTERIDLLKFMELLKVLEVPVDDFFEGSGGPFGSLKSNRVLVPLLGEVACGPGADAEGIRAKEGEPIEGTADDRGALGLCVAGRSMEPRYQSGDILFWRRIDPEIVFPGGDQAETALDAIKRYHGWTCVMVHDNKPTLKILDIRLSPREPVSIPVSRLPQPGSSGSMPAVMLNRGFATAKNAADYVVYLRPVNPEFNTVMVRMNEELRIQGYIYKLVRFER